MAYKTIVAHFQNDKKIQNDSLHCNPVQDKMDVQDIQIFNSLELKFLILLQTTLQQQSILPTVTLWSKLASVVWPCVLFCYDATLQFCVTIRAGQ